MAGDGVWGGSDKLSMDGGIYMFGGSFGNGWPRRVQQVFKNVSRIVSVSI